MGRRVGIGCLFAIALTSSAGCKRALQIDDASAPAPGTLDPSLAIDATAAPGGDGRTPGTGGVGGDPAPDPGGLNQPTVPGARCGGRVAVLGLTPTGEPFRATALDTWLSGDFLPSCQRGVAFKMIDGDEGSAIMFVVNVSMFNGGPLVPGTRNVSAFWVAYDESGKIRDQAPSSAELEITAIDPPPFAVCEQPTIVPGTTLAGSVAFSIRMLKDGFNLSGTVTAPYCACTSCTAQAPS